MRELSELIDSTDSGYTLLNDWINESNRPIVKLPICTREKAEEALYSTQVTTRSLLGTVIYHTGGLLIDNGWIRVFGGGFQYKNDVLPSIKEWNLTKTITIEGQLIGCYIVAIDVLGGYYCINNRSLGYDEGNIYYFAPNTLKFEALEITYSELLYFFLTGNLDQFYLGFRWKTWKTDTKALPLDQVFHCTPFLWTNEGKQIEHVLKVPVQAEEEYALTYELSTGLKKIENKYR